MAASIASEQFHSRAPEQANPALEDLLAHLPLAATTKYSPNQTIYGPDHPSNSIYLVVAGSVGISRLAAEGVEVLLEIVRPEDLFGESAFLDIPRSAERAIALEKVELMSWDVANVGDMIVRRPRLAMALLQTVALRNAEFARRIESLCIDNIQQRLARSLIRLSERLGTPAEDGSTRMMPITHRMLSHYVGTSREIVTHHMNNFRKQGYVTYSRQGIRLHRDPLNTILEHKS
jgi:CRP/FNR family transcriptional regulator